MLDISGIQEIVRKLSCMPAEKKLNRAFSARWPHGGDGAPTDDPCLLLVHVR
jgi:hypothetical protein